MRAGGAMRRGLIVADGSVMPTVGAVQSRRDDRRIGAENGKGAGRRMGLNNQAFLRALADMLLPGGTFAHGVPLPAATDLGIDLKIENCLRDQQSEVAKAVALIIANAGDEDAFVGADPAARASVITAAQNQQPAAFAHLISQCLIAYYEHPRVIEAFGWPSAPPQPSGHELAPFDDKLLEPVRARGPIWRSA